jgi:hypothetical protein
VVILFSRRGDWANNVKTCCWLYGVAKPSGVPCEANSRSFMLSDKALKEFKQIWKEEIGEDISDDLAVENATQLLTFFDAVYRPIKKEWVKKYDDDKSNEQTN